jgi:hypothetical protein
MDSNIQALRIENLETRLGFRRFVSSSLELESEFAQTAAARQILAHQRTQEMKEYNVPRFALELLKREVE